MRIGIDARFYGSLGKGLGRYTEKLIEHLERASGDDTFVVFLRRENFDEYQPQNGHFEKRLADFPWYGWREQVFFPLLLMRERLDLVHFPHFNVPLWYLRPFVVTIHDLILLRFPTVKASELPPFLYWLKYVVYRLVISSAISRARRIITVSQFTKTDIEREFKNARGKITVTLEATSAPQEAPSPREEEERMKALGLDPAAGFILYVGNAYPHKNLDLIIDVAKRLKESNFVLVGRDDFFYRTIQERVLAERVSNIHFVGFVDDRTLTVLYRRARLYLFPSFYEGFGLPGLEAMQQGVPVVSSNAGSLPEIYGGAALYFDPHSVAECVNALERALSDSSLRDKLRSEGFHQVKRYSWQTMADQTIIVYRTALA